MTDKVLKDFRVFLRRRGGNTRGRVEVKGSSPSHAGRVGVKQTIENSFPKSKPSDWLVTSVEELGVGVAAVQVGVAP